MVASPTLERLWILQQYKHEAPASESGTARQSHTRWRFVLVLDDNVRPFPILHSLGDDGDDFRDRLESRANDDLGVVLRLANATSFDANVGSDVTASMGKAADGRLLFGMERLGQILDDESSSAQAAD